MTKPKTLRIDDVEYIRKDSAPNFHLATDESGLRYVIVRTYSAGVFAGFLKDRKGQEVVLVNARRIWYWDGAASLSQMAVSGVTKPQNCKFAMAVPMVELLQVIEILDCTVAARGNIEGVPVWRQ